MTKVFKFGGALMKDASGIIKVAAIIEEFSCEPLVVVVSALGKTTNALEKLLSLSFQGNTVEMQKQWFTLKQLHLSIVQNLLPEDYHDISQVIEEDFLRLWDALNIAYKDKYFAYDQIVGFGEGFASAIVNAYLHQNGIRSQMIDARSLIVTDSCHTDASIDWKLTAKTIQSRVIPVLEKKQVVLTQGFIGSDQSGEFTTLGREGSDFTAAIFAHVLSADEVSIWKDVPGLMNCDPKRFPEAEKLDIISYHEAIELAFYGASIIHPKTIQPLQQKKIPLKVRSFKQPESSPSLISNCTSHDNETHKVIVKDNQVLLSIQSKNLSFIAEENLTDIFKAISKNRIHINLMQNSAVSFSLCFNHDQDKLQALITALETDYLLKYNDGLQLITIRHYTDEVIDKLISGKEIFLEQKSRATVQYLVRDLV